MNLIQKETNKSLSIIKKPLTNKSQKALYAFILEKIKLNEPLKMNEITSLWIQHVCKNIIDGVPHYWDYWANPYKAEDGVTKHRGAYKPHSKEFIEKLSVIWLTRTIGVLVMKGLLKIIPQIEIEELSYLNKQ